MNLDRTLQRIHNGGHSDIKRAARDLGHEFIRNRLYILNKFRARMYVDPEDKTWFAGYASALLDIATAYSDALDNQIRVMLGDVSEAQKEEDEDSG